METRVVRDKNSERQEKYEERLPQFVLISRDKKEEIKQEDSGKVQLTAHKSEEYELGVAHVERKKYIHKMN